MNGGIFDISSQMCKRRTGAETLRNGHRGRSYMAIINRLN